MLVYSNERRNARRSQQNAKAIVSLTKSTKANRKAIRGLDFRVGRVETAVKELRNDGKQHFSVMMQKLNNIGAHIGASDHKADDGNHAAHSDAPDAAHDGGSGGAKDPPVMQLFKFVAACYSRGMAEPQFGGGFRLFGVQNDLEQVRNVLITVFCCSRIRARVAPHSNMEFMVKLHPDVKILKCMIDGEYDMFRRFENKYSNSPGKTYFIAGDCGTWNVYRDSVDLPWLPTSRVNQLGCACKKWVPFALYVEK